MRLLYIFSLLLLLAACTIQRGHESTPTVESAEPLEVVEPIDAVQEDEEITVGVAETELVEVPAEEPAEEMVEPPVEILEVVLPEPESVSMAPVEPVFIETLCDQVGNKLGSVSTKDCELQQLRHSGMSVQGRSLAYKDYHSDAPLGRVLLIGGIHGDEFSSISLTFRWMEILNEHHSGMFHWRFIPIANPDGLLKEESQRQNSNGVDLNRNFPTDDWENDAHDHWIDVTSRNPRRHPGDTGGSEVEKQWIVNQIDSFKPDIIVSIHAPHHLVDYDGPPRAPEKLGSLSLQRLGVFPGSLGNFAGNDLNLPVVTVELQYAGIMPRARDIDRMWMDLVGWLQQQLRETRPSATARAD
jgi:hypothetical protein